MLPREMNNKNKMYEFEKLAIVAIVVLVLAVAGVMYLAVKGSGRPAPSTTPDGNTEQSAETSGDESSMIGAQPVVPDNGIQFIELEVDNTKLSEGALVLVNQDHKYNVDESGNVENVYSYNQSAGNTTNWYGLMNVKQSLRKEALDALNDMYKDCYEALELDDVVITKSFVDAAAQQADYDAKAEKADASEKPYLQAGGCSEHQTGLAVNLSAPESVISWFTDNCWKYGFVARYPVGKESVTYVKDEPNHFRYVGVSHALYMKLNSLVMEEYLALLETKTNTSRLKLDVGTSDKYETYACKASSGATTKLLVPAENSGWSYIISGTNNGYFVVTIYQLHA